MSITYQELLAEQSAAFANIIRQFAEFQARFPNMPEHVSQIEDMFDVNCRAYYSTSYGGTLQVTLSDMDSFKDPALMELLTFLEDTYQVLFKSYDYPEAYQRNYIATYDWGHELDIRVEVRIRNDSNLCKRIQTGVKTVTTEVPTYELDCSEGELHVN